MASNGLLRAITDTADGSFRGVSGGGALGARPPGVTKGAPKKEKRKGKERERGEKRKKKGRRKKKGKKERESKKDKRKKKVKSI